jgi:anti-sigma regulatory factor (Ser/Thr protein kinase)
MTQKTVMPGYGWAGPALVMQFIDTGKHFNPLEKIDPDIGAPIENRAIGGLGIYIAKKWMDSIHYERAGGENRLTLYKNIAAQTQGAPSTVFPFQCFKKGAWRRN